MTAKIIGKRVMISSHSVIEGERLVDAIGFDLPASYGDVYLGDKKAYANIRRADGTTDKIPVPYVEEEGSLCVTWQIDASATAVPGDLDAHLSFESEEGDVVFMTERFTLKIQPSVDAYRDITDRSPSALHKLQAQMIVYVNRMQELLDEVNEKIEGLGNGEGVPSAPAYGADNKLPAEYVDGLAAVATSGSYADIADAPSMELYATKAELAQQGDELSEAVQPTFIKHISFEDDFNLLVERSEFNKSLLAGWKAKGAFNTPVYLWREETDTYYPVNHMIFTDDQVDIYFLINNTNYVATYNSKTNTYGFNG